MSGQLTSLVVLGSSDRARRMPAAALFRVGSLRRSASFRLTAAGLGGTPTFNANAEPRTPASAAAAEISVASIGGLVPVFAFEITTMKSMNSPANASTAP